MAQLKSEEATLISHSSLAADIIFFPGEKTQDYPLVYPLFESRQTKQNILYYLFCVINIIR